MFWQNYLSLCNQVGKSPTAVAKALGITSGTVTGWRKGVIPQQKTLQKIAEYFNVTAWSLLSETESVGATVPDTVATRQELRDSYASRILFDAANDATEADLLEAAALLMRRKAEREKG